jgi:hypothetical protein
LNAAVHPQRAREFAAEVVETLQAAGFQALWAGGCVRDRLLDRDPTDYDVATSARPEQVQLLFGVKRTLAIGAAFGVIAVIGPRGAGQVQVATFRSESQYSDGRHPDRVSYATAEADAQRRDFTINGMFFDPVGGQLLDFVGGRLDIEGRRIRAIGDPRERIREDKLRMLRAVRFAATLDFELDSETQAAICRHAEEIQLVSGERIAEEMRKLLVHPGRRRGVELLAVTHLLAEILPVDAWRTAVGQIESDEVKQAWERTRSVLAKLREPTFSVGLAALLREPCRRLAAGEALVETVGRNWRLARAETDGVHYCLEQEPVLRSARGRPWPELQRVLIGPRIAEALCFAEAVALVVDGTTEEIGYCQRKLSVSSAILNPPPLISGEDLQSVGIPRGPIYRLLLEFVRDAQLLGQIQDRNAAVDLALREWRSRETH